MIDLRLLRSCERVLDSLLGAEGSLLFEGEGINSSVPDAFFLLRLPGIDSLKVCVELKRNLRPSMVPQLKQRINTWKKKNLCEKVAIFSDYIPVPLAKLMREEKIWFVDAAGNAYLEIPDRFLLYVTGNRLHRVATRKGQYFTETGAKALFYLLKHGPDIEATYRDLSAATSVSLDKISKLLNELKDDATIVQQRQGCYQVRNPRRLLDMWVEAFVAKLHPKIILGQYKSPYGENIAALLEAGLRDDALGNVIVGGEYAADLLTGYLRASSATIYVRLREIDSVQQNLKLAPSKEGPIEVCAAFAPEIGNLSEEHGFVLADPVLVYAELLATDDPRCGETALLIKEKHLPWIQ